MNDSKSPQPICISVEEIDSLCDQIATGREATRRLKQLIGSREISEVEFRLLWHLRSGKKVDQKSLAEALGVSTAQVSASVEAMRKRRLIACSKDRQDRRRQTWQLAIGGVTLLTSLTTGGITWMKGAA
ncbi:MAG: helix-turn-helix domain-containing protein [Lacipirellulaceae bacterium]